MPLGCTEDVEGGLGGRVRGEPFRGALPPDVTLDRRIVDPDGSSLEVVGARAARLDKIELSAVTASLGPTVVGGDQLTPVRSRAEASADYMPGYLGTDVNFVTDDQVVIAAHIALAHDLPQLVADDVTQRIITERRKGSAEVRPSASKPGSFGKAFNDTWTNKLRQLERLIKA